MITESLSSDLHREEETSVLRLESLKWKEDYLISLATDVQHSECCFFFVQRTISGEHAFDRLLV